MNFNDLKKQKLIHFIGIGGIGMSALALILKDYMINVQGSDQNDNYLLKKLKEKNITYFIGHSKTNIIDDVSLVVITSIIKENNEELMEAKKRGIKIITRANLLAIIMQEKKSITIAGTHGKTTTTALTSLVLEFGDLDPTVVNGGVINYYKSNSKIGKSEYLIAESDESDGSFVDLPTTIGAVTNIEPEHLEHEAYNGNFETQKKLFIQYINSAAKNGFCVICIDDKNIQEIYKNLENKENIITYSIKKDADIFAKNIRINSEGIKFDAVFNKIEIKDIAMQVYGIHFVSNALIPIAIGIKLGIEPKNIKLALSKFDGVKRRFSKVGEYDGVTIIDDYAHHPTEIKATIAAARNFVGKNKIICVFEPHKYSRVEALYSEFCEAFKDADLVIVTDIYSAGQPPIEGVNQANLARDIESSDKNKKIEVIKLPIDEPDLNLAKIIKSKTLNKGDLILCLGAGKVTYLASNLEENLKKI